MQMLHLCSSSFSMQLAINYFLTDLRVCCLLECLKDSLSTCKRYQFADFITPVQDVCNLSHRASKAKKHKLLSTLIISCT